MRLNEYKKQLEESIPKLRALGKKTDFLELELEKINCKNPDFSDRIELDDLFGKSLGNRYDTIYMSKFESWSLKEYGQVVDEKMNKSLHEARLKEFQEKHTKKRYKKYFK